MTERKEGWLSRILHGKKTSDKPAPDLSANLIDESPPELQLTHPTETKAEPEAGLKVAAPAPKHSEELRAVEAEVPLEWDVGDVILGLYEVKHIHEGGGMGLVYRAHHLGWNIDLAVKSPRPDYFQTEDQKENFVRECETWINLGLHPNMVSCYYVRNLGGIPRVFAEYVEGGSLSDWIRHRKLYEGGPEEPLERILDVAIQFAWGLHYAHEQGVIHQDVKPANVMITPEETAKVTDFGLAKARGITGERPEMLPERSVMVSVGGMTPAYCSPEQASGEPLSRKTDIWSWGLSVLEMFTGEMSWIAGQVAGEVLESYLEMEVGEDGIPKMPGGVAELLRWCFQRNPDDRPKDMQETVAKLCGIYQQITGKGYLREEPKAAELMADGLNNRAVSMLDLGKKREAVTCFKEALKKEITHPEATYNLSLLEWRDGDIDDTEVIRRLENCRRNAAYDKRRVAKLLSAAHAERFDLDSAKAVLREFPDAYEELFSKDEPTQITCLRTLEGHDAKVNSVAITSDARYAVSGASGGVLSKAAAKDKTLRVWDLETGASLRTINAILGAVAISPDGQFAVSGSADKTLRVWDLETGTCLKTLEGHTRGVSSVTITPDGRFAVSGSWDKTLRLWDLNTGQCISTMEGHTNWVNSVAITSDGRLAVSGSADKTLKVWDLETGRCLKTLKGHADKVESVAITPDGRYAVSGDSDATLKMWNLADGACLNTLLLSKSRTDKQIKPVAITPDGRYAVSPGEWNYPSGRIWELETGTLVRTLEGLKYVNSIAISLNAPYAVIGCVSPPLTFWEFSSTKRYRAQVVLCRVKSLEILGEEERYRDEKLKQVRALLEEKRFKESFSLLTALWKEVGYIEDKAISGLYKKLLAVGKTKGLLASFRLKDLTTQASWGKSVAISSDGRYAVLGCWDKTVQLWELETGICLKTLEGHLGQVFSVAITLDGRFAVSASYDQSLRVWDLTKGTCIQTLKGHTGSVSSVALTPEGRYAVSGSADKTLRVWDVKTGTCLITLEGHTRGVAFVALTYDRRHALSGSPDGTLKLWELESGACLKSIEVKKDAGKYRVYVKSVATTPDGRYAVLAGNFDKTLWMWDLETGTCLRTLEGHTNAVESVAITPDGQFAVSGSADKTLRVWDLETGTCLTTLEGHTRFVDSVAITPDGQFTVSGGQDKTLKVWRFIWDLEFPNPVD